MPSLLEKEIKKLKPERFFIVNEYINNKKYKLTNEKEKLEILKEQDRFVNEIADYSHENKILFILDNDIEIVNDTLIISSDYYLYKINLNSNILFNFNAYSESITIKTGKEELTIQLRTEEEEYFNFKNNNYIIEISKQECYLLFIKLLKIMLKKYYGGIYPQL